MKKSFLPLLLAVLCLSCENPKPKITTGDDPHVDSLLAKARANAKIQFEEIDRKMDAHQDSIDLRSKQTIKSASIATQYVFVRLEIEEDKGMRIQQGNFVSGIQEIKSLTEDEKARLEDQVLTEYLKSSGAQLFNGRVKKKETFVFSSYKEASAKRNSFLISE
ncbi:hypothetical protein [Chryseobacterium bernardetii]|uniref:hypothetical protein n=1 Tax=Chryseobacterium bernardetii TaxID=1241978 RepID=UPI003AF7F39F